MTASRSKSIAISVEECARRIVARELEVPVALHDDGSKPGMFDLRVGPLTAPDIAIECIGAVDPVRTETWNVGPAKGPLHLQVQGDWHVVLKPGARVRKVLGSLEALLQQCEGVGLTGFIPVDWNLKRQHKSLFAEFESLGISSVSCYREGSTGVVYLGMTGMGGAVDSTGSAVPGWIGDFLRHPQRADVLRKLSTSNAGQRHVFVAVSFGGVPWMVESYLGSKSNTAPEGKPDLPGSVDCVWIMYGRTGLRWDGHGWQTFDAIVPHSEA